MVEKAKNREQWTSFLGVVLMALLLPGILRLTNSLVRYVVGAEGRLSAIAVESDRVLGPMPKPWTALAQGGDNLKAFLQGHESKVQVLGPKYLRIDHIYDLFNVVSRNDSGLVFNWTELDKLVEEIVAVGARPFFSLSYMPVAISSGDILSEPKDWQEWSLVVQKTIEHYSGELGLSDVYYEVWNEPDLFGNWKIGGKKDYRVLYYYAALGAARANGVKAYKLGGPATTGLYKNWLDGMFRYVMQNKLRMDFFSYHRYDLDLLKYAEDVKSIDLWVNSYPYLSHVEKIVSEMGPSSEMGGNNDNILGAAYTVATARELMGKIKYGFGFSVSGNWGVIGKPRYESLQFLSRLGENRLSVTGEGSWVKAIGAKNGSKYQVLLVNYDPKQTHSEVVPVSFLGLNDKLFNLTVEMVGGIKRTVEVATTEAILQTSVPMSPNSVAIVELEAKN
ncbi:hypothetical protein A2397_02890 [Candidatus Amesbacteria bacterium RIFOXYB1_FULL_44_23]|uniref:Glycosyl hydrolases family 39 N-terminal catalytic domain-containing protein n=1 Tax=Candidatus Amesbacteria bacterium RIFOXYB1_FULL_44_23 TaxID=1797263 RepID=A0A1F4ZTU9_9BACT|nr:MAG: hypothetical protein A2397_02890 [Candidatus Amesbacteria bacterium RIFOXYB1_FULL_44_23]